MSFFNLIKSICAIMLIVALTPVLSSVQNNAKISTIQIEDIRYNGYICFLTKVDHNIVDIYIRPSEDCTLQAFDIYFNTSNIKVVSHTGLNIDNYDTHIISIANGLEMEMLAHCNYKIATVEFPSMVIPYSVYLIKADLAIAHTPLAPAMDPCYLNFDPIIVD